MSTQPEKEHRADCPNSEYATDIKCHCPESREAAVGDQKSYSDDSEALSFLEARGFTTAHNGQLIQPPKGKTWDTLDIEEKETVNYLIDEWDYGLKENDQPAQDQPPVSDKHRECLKEIWSARDECFKDLSDVGFAIKEADEAALKVIARFFPPDQEAVDWQDISIAPKDGTEILLWGGGKYGDMGLCYWRDDEVMRGWTWGLGKAFLAPTHWMPLPKPPQ